MKNKFLVFILIFFSFNIFATSIQQLEKKKFVEDANLNIVSVRTSSDYFGVMNLIQQTGILQDITFDKIELYNISENISELNYYSGGGLVLEGSIYLTYVSPTSWSIEWDEAFYLLLEGGDVLLLESGDHIVLEKSN